MTILNVSDRDQLLAALKSAAGGDTILLAKADYGSVEITQDYTSMVTIKSATPLAAKFSTISIRDASNVRIDGVHVDNGGNGSIATKLVWIFDGQSIQFVNSEVNGLVDENYSGNVGIQVEAGTANVLLENNYIHDVARGSINFGVQNLDISENDFHRIGEDTMKFASVSQGIIENNFGTGPFLSGAHLDFVQVQGGSSSNLTFRGNVILPEKYANYQGIFVNNEYTSNLLIEDNIVVTSLPNGIFVSNGDGVKIVDNTLINISDSATFIKLNYGSAYVYNNVTTHWRDLGINGDNLVIQSYKPGSDHYVTNYYVNGDEGLGMTISDLAIVQGSHAETMGAFSRIKGLLGGSASAPSPEPDPATGAPPEMLYSKLGNTEITGNSSVVNLAHDSKYAVNAATIAFSFDADTVSGRRGLLTKDAYMYEGGGNHFAAYLIDGKLDVMFESASTRKTFTVSGINANQEYDLQASFGGGKVSVWLDDKLVGSSSFNTDWTYNKEYLQIGAHGGWSGSGASDFQYVFDGTISDVRIAEGVQSLAAMDTLL